MDPDAAPPGGRTPRRRRAAAAWVMLTAAASTAFAAAVPASGRRVPGADAWLLHRINDLPDGLAPLLEAVMQLGSLALVPVVALGVLAVWRRWQPALATLAAGVVARSLAIEVKRIVERGRPPAFLSGVHVRDAAGGYGFASGHTAVAFALATVVAPLVPRRLRWLPWLLAALVGFSRVYVGAHFPLDVVGGAALGTTVGIAATLAPGVRSEE